MNTRFAEFLARWSGTPYMAGQCCPSGGHELQGGVDCLRYVDDWCQMLRRVTLAPLPRHAQDAAFHDPRIVAHTIALMLDRHGASEILVDREALQAYDILGVQLAGNPFHVGILDADLVTVWHADRPNGANSRGSLQGLDTNGLKVRRAMRLPAEYFR